MNRILCLSVAASFALAGAALVGCQSNNQSHPDTSDHQTAGGNGEFGESPVSPGTYQGSGGTDASGAPTTQP